MSLGFPIGEKFSKKLWLMSGLIDTNRETESPNLEVGKADVVFIVLWSGAHGGPGKGQKGSCRKPDPEAKRKRFGRVGMRL